MSTPPYLQPPPWPGGGSFEPPTAGDIASIEAALVQRLQLQIGSNGPNAVEVVHFPDKPEKYREVHRIGVVMVIYGGSDYGEIIDTSFMMQERTLEWVIAVLMRDLGWAYGGPRSGTSPGAYSIIEAIRAALIGWVPTGACTQMRPLGDKFVERDSEGGVWIYEMRFSTRAMSVPYYAPPDDQYPPLTHIKLMEENAITTTPVPAASYTFSGTAPQTVTLPQRNVSMVVVMSSNLAITYVLNTDYLLDSVHGIITQITTGAITANEQVTVSYDYADIVDVPDPNWPQQ